MRCISLASGSSGNCYYIGNKQNGVLVDAGISAKQTLLRMASNGISSDNVKAILITHEHTDHTRGSDVLARALQIPIYATRKTAEARELCKDKDLIKEIERKDIFSIDGMQIEAFPKTHAAADPVGFTIQNKRRVSVISDAGHACKHIISEVKDADALFLESNHDLKMLENGPYPAYLKKWVGGDDGHLSNMQAALCVLEYANSKLKHLSLSHLSAVNNKPAVALHTMRNILKERKDFRAEISVAHRDRASDVFEV